MKGALCVSGTGWGRSCGEYVSVRGECVPARSSTAAPALRPVKGADSGVHRTLERVVVSFEKKTSSEMSDQTLLGMRHLSHR